ncbi:CrcB-like protein-domain-containing protein [Poronia punctata]|nr:CrcB-like protein-domain-containing protein [Poronia punctata]
MPPSPRSPGPRSSHSVAMPEPDTALLPAQQTREPARSTASQPTSICRQRSDFEIPPSCLNVTEVLTPTLVQNQTIQLAPHSQSTEELPVRHRAEELSGRTGGLSVVEERMSLPQSTDNSEPRDKTCVPKWRTELYIVSYLILFAILGTLARLGLQALTFYPGTPLAFSSIWPNFAGSLIIGFLAEDCNLFRFLVATPSAASLQARAKRDEEPASSDRQGPVVQDLAAQKKAHLAVKKTVPLYIGLATGFCGSFTSFSSFIRDIFLALSNDLPGLGDMDVSRNGGYSFLALLAVTIATISLSFSGFYLGGQLALELTPLALSLPCDVTRKVVDPLAVVLGWGAWLGAILLSILPPDRYSQPDASEFWRGRVAFALVFAPLGCLSRFYVSARLNGRVATFPLGTFVVNITGTVLLGLAWDLAHSSQGGVLGCQVLQGIEDGLCGCLTTVSTWVMELAVLSHRKAYIYGGGSVLSAFSLLLAIMGGLRWSQGFSAVSCVH